MKIFVADGGNRDRREYCLQHGIGLLFSPAYYVPPPAGASYIIDNGAFGAWTRGIEWDEGAFYTLLHKIESTGDRPYAVVVPDVVAGGLASLKRSAQHIPLIPDEFPKYLPVQDGMTPAAVKPLIEDVDGVFVGGTVAWKWRTSQLWAEFAHNAGKLCHIGRVGNKRNYSRAYAAGADSVDGSTPMRHNKLHVIPEWRDEVAKQANLLSKEEWMLNVGSAVADSRSFGRKGVDHNDWNL